MSSFDTQKNARSYSVFVRKLLGSCATTRAMSQLNYYVNACNQ